MKQMQTITGSYNIHRIRIVDAQVYSHKRVEKLKKKFKYLIKTTGQDRLRVFEISYIIQKYLKSIMYNLEKEKSRTLYCRDKSI